MNSMKLQIDEQFHYTVQNPTTEPCKKSLQQDLLEMYREGELDEVYIIYTTMINAMQEETQMQTAAPTEKAGFSTVKLPVGYPAWRNLALRPSPEAVMDRIVPNYVVGFIYRCAGRVLFLQ